MEQPPFVASDEEAVIAREAVDRLEPIARAKQDVRLRVMESCDVVVPLPARAVGLIVQVLRLMADQKAVSFIPHEAEFTTQQAADLLNVSRPYLVALLERGELSHRKVGAHRRVKAADLLAYRTTRDETHRAAVDEMARLSQEMGLD